MSAYNVERDFNESVLKKTALTILKAEEQDEILGLSKTGSTLVPTYMGNMIENIVVISWEVILKHWQDLVFIDLGWKQASKKLLFLLSICLIKMTNRY